jgi:hypothetical protein
LLNPSQLDLPQEPEPEEGMILLLALLEPFQDWQVQQKHLEKLLSSSLKYKQGMLNTSKT